MNFKEYLKLCELAIEDGPLGTVIPSSPFGAVPSYNGAGKPNSGDPAPIRPARSDFDLGLPQIPVTSAIKWISGPGMQQPGQSTLDGTNKNIVHISLENGLNLFMSRDEFKRIAGEPRVGKMATVVLQRRTDDTSRLPSQVQSFTVH